MHRRSILWAMRWGHILFLIIFLTASYGWANAYQTQAHTPEIRTYESLILAQSERRLDPMEAHRRARRQVRPNDISGTKRYTTTTPPNKRRKSYNSRTAGGSSKTAPKRTPKSSKKSTARSSKIAKVPTPKIKPMSDNKGNPTRVARGSEMVPSSTIIWNHNEPERTFDTKPYPKHKPLSYIVEETLIPPAKPIPDKGSSPNHTSNTPTGFSENAKAPYPEPKPQNVSTRKTTSMSKTISSKKSVNGFRLGTMNGTRIVLDIDQEAQYSVKENNAKSLVLDIKDTSWNTANTKKFSSQDLLKSYIAKKNGQGGTRLTLYFKKNFKLMKVFTLPADKNKSFRIVIDTQKK